MAQEITGPSGGSSTGGTGTTTATPAASSTTAAGPTEGFTRSNSAAAAGIGFGTSILPATGFGGNLGNIRDFVNTPLTRGPTRTFTFDGSVGVQAGYTDNVNGYTGGAGTQKAKGSASLQVTPTLTVNADTRTTQVNLTYNPTLLYYPSADGQSRIDQSLNGGSSTTIIPGLAYLDLRAFAAQTSNSNIAGPTSSSVLSRQDRSQVYDFSAHPYLVQQFAYGTGRVGYTIDSTTTQNGSNVNTVNTNYNGFGPVYANSGNSRTLTQTEDASFTTGDTFGRWNHTVALSGSQTSGTGSLRNASRNIATYDIAYAYSRFLSLTGEIGYENLTYSGTTTNGVVTSLPTKVNEVIYSIGFVATPNADSSIALSYGHIDGGETLTLRATYQPTARIVLYATSSSGLTTNAQQVQNYVNGSQVAPNGVTVDPRTGAPVQYASTGTNNANQVYRLTQTSLTALWLLNRDNFTASLIRSDRSSPNGGNTTGVSGTSTSGSLGWGHDVSDSVKTNATFSYGVDESRGGTGTVNQSSPTYSAAATITKTFTEKLSGNASYTYYRRDSSTSGTTAGQTSNQGITVNQFLIGLLQRF